MDWQGEGLIIGVRKHGETSVIIEVMSAVRGRHMGLVRGGRSRKLAATLQPGNTVKLEWRARLDEHLGIFTVELLHPRAAKLLADRNALLVAQLICAHFRLLPERDPHDRLFDLALTIMDTDLTAIEQAQMLTLFEFYLLEELGFGLDISSCAVSGETEGLTHVSPRTGRAVTRAAGGDYLDRLLKLPAYFYSSAKAELNDIIHGFQLTGHFLDMHVWAVRQIEHPTVRDQLITALRDQV